MITYDFHIHSLLSPCGNSEMTPNNIVNMANIMGLSAIAVSDHNTVGNVKSVMKVGEKHGITVIPAMEVETEEEVHILTLFPDFESARYVSEEVYKRLPEVKNRPEIFGEQILMDENDCIVGYEEKMLIAPTQMSVNTLFDIVAEAKGIFIPAHVDRHSYSVLTNLGFIPDDIDIKCIEISRKTLDLEAYLMSRPDLNKYEILRSSDAHNLESMADEPAVLKYSIEEMFNNLR